MIRGTSSNLPTEDRDELLDRLFEEVQQADNPGQELERLAGEHPEVADRLRRMVEMVELLESAPSLAPTGPWDYGAVAQPERIGDYSIEGEIARGGMGIVYKGRDRNLGRVVAIKTLLNADAGERFANEQKFLARFHETSIVALHGADYWQGRPYMVMPFIDGAPLNQVVRAGRYLSASPKAESTASSVAGLAGLSKDPEWAKDSGVSAGEPGGEYPNLSGEYYRSVARCVAAIARAIQAVHDQNLVHRDLKPENVMVEFNGHAWIIDLGVARELTANSDEEPTETRLLEEADIAGTVPYMAPEQFDRQFGKPTDIWGLGMILYELLTFQRAYRVSLDETPVSERSQFKTAEHFLQHAEARRTPVDPLDVSHRIPADLAAICRKCLRYEPIRRYDSAQDLADDLERWLKDEPVKARKISQLTRLWKWSRRRPGRATLIAAAILALLGTGIGLSIHNKQLGAALTETTRRENTVRRQQASNQVALGYDAWNRSRIDEALVQLHQDYRLTDGSDLRGWEWYLLNGLCQTEAAIMKHPAAVTAVAFSPDDKIVYSGDAQGKVRWWDPGAEQPQRTLPAHDGRILRMLVSPNGERVVTVGADARVRLWKLPEWTSLHDWKDHGDEVRAVAFHPDSRKLATGGADGLVFIRDVESGKTEEVLEQNDSVFSLDFSPDGTELVVGVRSELVLYDATDWSSAVRESVRGKPLFVRFEPGGKSLLVSYQRGKVDRLSLQNGSMETIIETGTSLPQDLLFSPEGETVFIAADDGTVSVHKRRLGFRRRIIRGHRPTYSGWTRGVDGVYQADLSSDGEQLATAGADGTLRLWNLVASPAVSVLSGHDITVYALDVSPDGNLVVSGGLDNTVRVWDWRERKTVAQLGRTKVTKDQRDLPLQSKNIDGHTAIVTDVAFSPDGRQVASVSFDQTARIWDLETVKEEKRLRHPVSLISADFDPQGRQLATAAWDDVIRVWDLETERVVWELKGHTAHPRRVRYIGPSLLASCGEDGTVRIWDTKAGKELRAWVAHAGVARSLAIDSKRRWIASGGSDQTVRIWEIATGKLVMRLSGQTGDIRGLAFHPRQPRLASVANAKPGIVIWDLETKQTVATLDGKGDVYFSQDGWRLISAGSQNTINVWDAKYGKDCPLRPIPADLPSDRLVESAPPAEGLRVLGYRYAEVVVDAIRPGKVRRAPQGKRFLLVAISVPAAALAPGGVEYGQLQREADEKDQAPIGPADRMLYMQPELFGLMLPDGTELAGELIEDWPAPEGLHVGVNSSSSERYRASSRICVCVGWALPEEEEHQLPSIRVRGGEAVPIVDRVLQFGDAVVEEK